MKYALKDAVASEVSVNPTNNNINWNDFNYPPCLKLISYHRDKIPESHQREITLLWLNHILIAVTTIVNFLTNIIATAQGDAGGGIRIGISVFLLLLWAPIGTYLFYLPYSIQLRNKGSKFVFYILSFVTFVWFFIWSIANFADANGWVRVGDYFGSGKGAAGVFGIIESVLCMSITGLTAYNAYRFYKAE